MNDGQPVGRSFVFQSNATVSVRSKSNLDFASMNVVQTWKTTSTHAENSLRVVVVDLLVPIVQLERSTEHN